MSTYQLLETIKTCSNPSAMEMSETTAQIFRSIESIVRNFHETIKPFQKMQFHGGNEIFLTEIAMRLKNYLRSKQLYNTNGLPNHDHCQLLKRITFYLMLNCDVVFKYDLNKDVRICHLLNTMPQLPPCVLVHIVWSLNLERYFFDALAYCPIWFAMQFMGTAIDSLRHAELDDVNRRLNGMLKAIYLNVARMDYYVGPKDDKVEKKIVLGKIQEHVTGLLRHYNTPDADKFGKWSAKKKHRYDGHVLYYLLEVVRRSLDWFEHQPPLWFDDVFDVQLEDETRAHTDRSSVVHDNLLEINTCLLNTLQNVVMTITLDAFVYWVELDIDENDPENPLPPLGDEFTEYTLQYAVGVSAYRLKETINTNEVFAHDVREQLNTICVKPQMLEDRLKTLKMSELITKLDEIDHNDSDSVRKKWLNEFMSRGEIVFGNEECMETVENCIGLFDGENIKLMTSHLESMTLDTTEKQTLERILIKAIDVLTVDETVDVIVDLLVRYGPKFSFTELEDFDSLLVEYLNKTTAGALDVKGYLKIVCQAPQLVHERIFQQLPTVTHEQVMILSRLIVATAPISKRFVEVAVDDIQTIDTAKLTKLDKHVTFVVELLAGGVLDKREFFAKMTKQFLIKALTTENRRILWFNLQIMQRILNEPSNWDALGPIPPLIVLLATCMERSRWDIFTYDEIRESCVLATIGLAEEVVKKFAPAADRADKDWITAKLTQFSAMTKFYFQKLHPTEKAVPFDKFVLAEAFSKLDWPQRKAKFCEIFVRCTPEEVKLLAKNAELRDMFTDGTLVISRTIFKSTEMSTYGTLKYVLSNYLQFLKTSILPTMDDGTFDKYAALLHEIVEIVKHIPATVYATYFMDLCFLPLSEFLKRLMKLAKSVDECGVISVCLANLEDCEARENLLMIVKLELDTLATQSV